MSTLISPSILSADLLRLHEVMTALTQQGLTRIHFDVMDGHFVPNLSFGPALLGAIQSHCSTFTADVHLMIKLNQAILESFIKQNPRSIILHPESHPDILEWLALIPQPIRRGIAIKPNTTLADIKPLLPHIDTLLVMTVEPGFGGQKLMLSQLEKAKKIQTLKEKLGLSFEMGMDGGITTQNIQAVCACHPDFVVCGKDLVGSLSAIPEKAQQLHTLIS